MIYLFIILSLFCANDLTVEQRYDVKQLYSQMDLTKRNVYEYIRYKGFTEPEKVMKTICFESGHLRSNAAQNYGNITGMGFNKRGFAVQRSKTGLAIYRHWTDSIDDLYEWQAKSPCDDWYKLLRKRGFNKNKNYCKILERVRI